jgi:ABC-type transport system substrate-binding protein
MSVIRNLWSHRYQTLEFKSTPILHGVINRFFIVIHIGFMLISCHSAPDSQNRQVIRFNSPTGITSLDPAFARTQENIRAVNQLFNGLLQLDKDLNLAPAIAKKWSVSSDSKTYTFTLRNDVLFHNDPIFGSTKRAVVAKDFVYSFTRLISPKTASDGAWIFNGIVAESNPFVALNDSTLQINLKKPFTPLLSLLTMAYCYVVPQEAVEHYGLDFGKHPVGTGPFRFANWHNGIKLNFLKNENYFESSLSDPIPKLEAISISFIQSKQTELLEFSQGKLDLFTGLESSFKDEILNAKGDLQAKYAKEFTLIKSPYLNTEYIGFNVENENSPVHNLYFRKAISYAIDRQAMITYLRNNVGKPADGGFSPNGLPSYRKASESLYNPTKAKEFLKKSSIKQTKPILLTTTRDYLDLCILVQKNCASIGIQLKIEVVPSSLLKQQKSVGDLSFFRGSWIADYPDGENYMACFYGPNKAPNGPNYTRYENANFDVNYELLLKENDLTKREELFTALEDNLSQNQPFALLFYDESIWIKSQEVKGLVINSLNQMDLRRTTLHQ